MFSGLKTFGTLLRRTVDEFSKDNCTRMAAALSYYTVFALPAFMVIVISAAGVFVSPEDIQGRIRREIISVIGEAGAKQVEIMIEHANQTEKRGGQALFGIAMLLIGATGVMGQLQAALNEAWGVSVPQGHVFQNFVLKRLISLGMILAVAFVLVVSLVFDTIVVAFGQQIAAHAFPNASRPTILVGDLVGTFLLFSFVFAAMYKYLPDVRIDWRDVWLGAAITAFLFMVGKWLLSFYLTHHDVASNFGAAGSLALILVWIYYSGIIFLFGAEFTQVWSGRHKPSSASSDQDRKAGAQPNSLKQSA